MSFARGEPTGSIDEVAQIAMNMASYDATAMTIGRPWGGRVVDGKYTVSNLPIDEAWPEMMEEAHGQGQEVVYLVSIQRDAPIDTIDAEGMDRVTGTLISVIAADDARILVEYQGAWVEVRSQHVGGSLVDLARQLLANQSQP